MKRWVAFGILAGSVFVMSGSCQGPDAFYRPLGVEIGVGGTGYGGFIGGFGTGGVGVGDFIAGPAARPGSLARPGSPG